MSEGPEDEQDEGEQDEGEQDDALLLALAEHARERPSVWEPVVRGERSVEEVASQAGAELERARAYFQPFDASETRAIVEGVLARALPADAPPADAPPAGPVAEVVQLRPRAGNRNAILVGVLLAVAAAAALWLIWPRSEIANTAPTIAAREPIPEYGVEASGWLKTLRDDTPTAPSRYRYRQETSFEWVLRPQAKVVDALALRAFVVDEGRPEGVPLEIGPLSEIATTGGIRIHGTIAQLNLAPGRYTIVLVVGRPDALPDQAAALADPTSEPAWRVVRIDIDIEG